VQRRLSTIERASVRAADLVRRILTFSRRQDVAPQSVDLAPLVEEAIQLLRATLPAMIDIRWHVVPGVLPAVAADAGQIHQVIMNLATNAFHAMREHGGALEIRLDAVKVSAEHARLSPELQVGPYVKLSVTDSGCGMDRATLTRIFDPFFTTKSPGEGTGLGLSVVHGIMQSHRGAITVYSEPGRGTAFHLYFPVIDTVAEVSPARDPLPLGHGERLLYVDDEDALVVLGTEMLRRLGYHVTACNNPTEALQTFRSRPRDFDAVVSDVAMPGMSGLDLASALLEIRPGVPIVICSGYFTDTDAAAARRLGIRGVLHKPYTDQDLGQALHNLFDDSPGELPDGPGRPA
jgi:CheY-like chemotaxis protein